MPVLGGLYLFLFLKCYQFAYYVRDLAHLVKRICCIFAASN